MEEMELIRVVGIISQGMHIANYHIVQFKYVIYFFLVIYTQIKQEKN